MHRSCPARAAKRPSGHGKHTRREPLNLPAAQTLHTPSPTSVLRAELTCMPPALERPAGQPSQLAATPTLRSHEPIPHRCTQLLPRLSLARPRGHEKHRLAPPRISRISSAFPPPCAPASQWSSCNCAIVLAFGACVIRPTGQRTQEPLAYFSWVPVTFPLVFVCLCRNGKSTK